MNPYVVTLTQRNGTKVKAVKVDADRKTDVMHIIDRKYPDWNIKSILRLYPEDFMEPLE